MSPPKRYHVAVPPNRQRGERTATYVARVHEWVDERRGALEEAHRALPPLEGLSQLAIQLVDTVAWCSFAKGPRYHPIALGQRTVAGLLGLAGRTANAVAKDIVRELEDNGVLVCVQTSSGSRPALYILEPTPGTEQAAQWRLIVQSAARDGALRATRSNLYGHKSGEEVVPYTILKGHKSEDEAFVPYTYLKGHKCAQLKSIVKKKARRGEPRPGPQGDRDSRAPDEPAARMSLSEWLESADEITRQQALGVMGRE